MPDHDFAIFKIQKSVTEGSCFVKGRIAILKWMLAKDKLTIGNEAYPFTVVNEKLAHWLHENVSGIRMKLVLTREASFKFAQWVIAHKERYEIEGIAEFMLRVVRNEYSDRLPWLLEVSPERIILQIWPKCMILPCSNCHTRRIQSNTLTTLRSPLRYACNQVVSDGIRLERRKRTSEVD